MTKAPNDSMSVLFLRSGDAELEQLGIDLLNDVSFWLRSLDLPTGVNGVIPEGPHFNYALGPELFLGRQGRGPLRIVWDTNLLIDYFETGRVLWDGASVPDVVSGERGEELEALQLIIGLWVVRDIRFELLPRVLQDAREQLSASRLADRCRAFEAFALALSLGPPDDQPARAVPGDDRHDRPTPVERTRALDSLPKGTDRALVDDAINGGAHVFLTRDKGILRRRDVLRPFGLALLSPGDLLVELVAVGAFHCMLDRRYALWPCPDLQRVTHLIQAMPD